MSIQSIQQIEFPKLPEAITTTPNTNSSNLLNISVSTGFVAYVGQMPSTATIDSIFFKTTASTGFYSLLVRMENVALSSGVPNGILIHPSASAVVNIAPGGNNYDIRFPEPFTIPRSTIFSIVISGELQPGGIRHS